MFKKRLENLRKSLEANKVNAILVSSAANIFYLTRIDSFSQTEREAYLFVTERTAMLFTDGRYIEGIKNKLPNSVNAFFHTEMFKKIKKTNYKQIGVEQNFTVAELKRFKKETSLNFTLTKPLIEPLRAIKDAEEIKNMRLACQLTDKCYSNVLKNIRMNITEKELAWGIEKFIKEAGGELAFDTIVAFGPNSAIPHHKTSDKGLLKSDEFVLLDFGAKVNGYCSDITRTLLTKNASDRAHKIYETVRIAQQKTIEMVNSQWSIVNGQDITKATNKYITSQGFNEIPHGLGHGVGLEVHESPRLSPKSKDKLAQNNVFTIEPGIYIPGFGGVRIEDDFLLSDKLEQLTHSPKEMVEISI